MSYCVNCGVKLIESEKECPLCDCPVINPFGNKELPENAERPYPKRRDILKGIVDRRFIISVISIIYLISIIICAAVDFIINSAFTWSLITTTSILLGWAFIILPVIVNKKAAVVYITADFALLMLLFYSIASFSGTYVWVLTLAFPIAIAAYIFINIFTYGVLKNFLRGLYTIAYILATTVIFCVITEFFVWKYMRANIIEDYQFSFWPIYVLIPCLIIAGFLCFIEKKKVIKRGLIKRFHI